METDNKRTKAQLLILLVLLQSARIYFACTFILLSLSRLPGCLHDLGSWGRRIFRFSLTLLHLSRSNVTTFCLHGDDLLQCNNVGMPYVRTSSIAAWTPTAFFGVGFFWASLKGSFTALLLMHPELLFFMQTLSFLYAVSRTTPVLWWLLIITLQAKARAIIHDDYIVSLVPEFRNTRGCSYFTDLLYLDKPWLVVTENTGDSISTIRHWTYFLARLMEESCDSDAWNTIPTYV